jgi:hypothetical protein
MVRKFRKTNGKDHSDEVIEIAMTGGLPADHPDYLAANAQVHKHTFQGRRFVTYGGLPDDMPNREPETREGLSGKVPSEMDEQEFLDYCTRAGLDPTEHRAALAANLAKPAPWLKQDSPPAPPPLITDKPTE